MSWYADESWCLSMGIACRCVFRNVLSVGNKQEVKYCVRWWVVLVKIRVERYLRVGDVVFGLCVVSHSFLYYYFHYVLYVMVTEESDFHYIQLSLHTDTFALYFGTTCKCQRLFFWFKILHFQL
jgi:hypothetical protein